MWRLQLDVRLLFIIIYAKESYCLLSNEKSEDKSSSSAPPLSSFQQYTNAIPSDQPVTPHGRRDVETSVKAYSWPSTIFSPLCETWAYFESERNDNNSLSWKYLDTLVERGGVDALDNWIDQSFWEFENSTALAMEIASQITQSNALDRQLLPMALSLRAHSPHCEMHRSLARDAAIAYGLYDIEKGTLPPPAFCLLSRRDEDGNIVGTQLVIDETLLTKALDELKMLELSEKNVEDEDSHLLTNLPGESIHPTTSSENDEFVAILYGQAGTSAFASLYKSLRQSQLNLVVRHMGFISYEENQDASVAFPTVMQGYGVRLDIRNVEYKAFDDGPDNSEDGDATSDWNEAGHHPEQSARNEYLGGLNLHTIFDRLQVDSTKPLATDLHALQTAAIRSHSFQLGSESIIPPAWQRRSLSMQAASLIVSSPDPLEALKGVSQNLPSVAHSLSNIQISESFEALAETATDLAAKIGAVSPGWGDAAFGFYVNSREVNIERPSFNIFQLLNVLKEEDATLRNLERSVRPALKKAAHVTRDGSNPGSSSAEWAALQSIRKMMEMGADKLADIGKSGDFSILNPTASESHDDEGIGSDPDEEEGSQIYRIDVGRGGKNAILYLNDIEKDAQYSSWPTSVQEMLYRSQFGGAPTVRRNLFTMLLVIDPADGSSSPVLDVVAQLLNVQFPLRLGVLIVNKDDVEKGLSSEPLNWDNGDRAFHASDSFLLLKHITNKYGGMVALNCLFHMLHESAEMDDTLSVEEFINAHVSLLVQMGVVDQGVSNVQDELMNLLRTRQDSDVDSNPKNKNMSYESAVRFAKDKLIRPGMSFYNGIPLPAGDAATFASKVNSILRNEQDHIMGLVMSGVIKDRTPKSVYATILSGDNLFKQYHPLLDESSGEYFIASAKSDDESLLLLSQPKADYNNVDALFVFEAMIDLDDSVGIDAVSSFLEVIISASDHSWHDSKTVSLAARILPTGGSTSSILSQVLGSLFCAASYFDAIDLKAVVDHTQHMKLEGDVDANFFDSIEGLSASVRRTMAEVVTKRELCHGAKHGSKHLYTANGRVYVPRSGLITLNDIKMLVNLELDRTIAITKLILKNLPSVSASSDISRTGRVLHHAIGRSAAALNTFFSSSTKPEGVSSALTADLDNPLFFSWNEDESENFQVQVSVILDPLTEPAQRVTSLLLAIRDVLKLPLKLIIAPRTVVDNDVPLSSYYRFVVDPLASASNPPKARFENLPTNHLLTLRMDVPELWDVQQAHGVQDSDNLRCDSRFGCGDEGYILSRDNRAEDLVNVTPTKGLVELTQIDYSLKSLLLFGQCYDVSKNTPPNGLQLTLDRMSLAAVAETEMAEILVEPDGSIGSQVNNIHASSRDHADTLVMKTAGYFQLRSNPGVWSLRIEEKSRGSEIYHLVEGKISASGQVSPAKTSVERKSKTLVAKDFTSPANVLLVKRKKGFEDAELYLDEGNSNRVSTDSNETVHVFSLATGHAYERLLKIMMLSVTKRTSAPVKFWLFSNFLSPSFKSSATYIAEQIGCEVEFVTYKWPEWLRGQSEKQRIIWGYKILFLDVLFPLNVKKIIYVDADQVIRGDLTELWNLDLDGAPYGYTPFCDSREETLGYQFWRTGFWKSHLRGKPYHISALYVVDLERFRRELVGDKLRSIYQQLSADPNSLANLDQDLPNYAQHDVRIFSLPQKWLWCESWCSDETKADAMTIDLCNNPEHKEAKISMAKRIISGDLFEESWEELDEMVRNYDDEFSKLKLA